MPGGLGISVGGLRGPLSALVSQPPTNAAGSLYRISAFGLSSRYGLLQVDYSRLFVPRWLC